MLVWQKVDLKKIRGAPWTAVFTNMIPQAQVALSMVVFFPILEGTVYG